MLLRVAGSSQIQWQTFCALKQDTPSYSEQSTKESGAGLEAGPEVK